MKSYRLGRFANQTIISLHFFTLHDIELQGSQEALAFDVINRVVPCLYIVHQQLFSMGCVDVQILHVLAAADCFALLTILILYFAFCAIALY